MKRYHWPGNVRELENMVRRLAALHPEDTLTAAIVDAELAEALPPPALETGKTPARAVRDGRALPRGALLELRP